ncbi:unnamed protein product [Pocillopora meandrina]|uniref:Uncharacterized protein n=1 Tax=Pocillopora meandrina TaxID=46732 RepID=A0AAU9XD86_9CNID|nr:unnamed protein product [Pocillopora meandrina]
MKIVFSQVFGLLLMATVGFALTCFQCKGLEQYCLQEKLRRNRTQDACNQYMDRCIIKTFMLDIGVIEMTRGCGREIECRLAAQDCRRKRSAHHRCHVTCCEGDYCNGSNQNICKLHVNVIFLMYSFLSVVMNLQ